MKHNTRTVGSAAAATLLLATIASGAPVETTHTWNNTGGGTWETPGNWSPAGVPVGWSNNGTPNDSSDDRWGHAVFGDAITAPATITYTGDKDLGSYTFDSPISYTLDTAGSTAIRIVGGPQPNRINVVRGNHTIDRVFIFTGNSIDAQAGTRLTISENFNGGDWNGARINYNNVSSGTRAQGTVVISGTGSTTGNNWGESSMAVYGGTLILNGPSNSISAALLQVESGATVGGNGVVNSTGRNATSRNHTFKSGSKLDPGFDDVNSGVGKLQFTATGYKNTLNPLMNLQLSTGAILDFDAGVAGVDSIDLDGDWGVTLNSNTLNLTDVGGAASGVYRLIDLTGAEGTISGNLVLGTRPASWTSATLFKDPGGKYIDLTVVVPEPSVLVLGALPVMGLLRRRR